MLSCDFVTLSLTTLKWLSSLPILMQESFWWWQCSDRYVTSILPPPPPPPTPSPRPSIISFEVSVHVKHHVYFMDNHSSQSNPAFWHPPLTMEGRRRDGRRTRLQEAVTVGVWRQDPAAGGRMQQLTLSLTPKPARGSIMKGVDARWLGADRGLKTAGPAPLAVEQASTTRVKQPPQTGGVHRTTPECHKCELRPLA